MLLLGLLAATLRNSTAQVGEHLHLFIGPKRTRMPSPHEFLSVLRFPAEACFVRVHDPGRRTRHDLTEYTRRSELEAFSSLGDTRCRNRLDIVAEGLHKQRMPYQAVDTFAFLVGRFSKQVSDLLFQRLAPLQDTESSRFVFRRMRLRLPCSIEEPQRQRRDLVLLQRRWDQRINIVEVIPGRQDSCTPAGHQLAKPTKKCLAALPNSTAYQFIKCIQEGDDHPMLDQHPDSAQRQTSKSFLSEVVLQSVSVQQRGKNSEDGDSLAGILQYRRRV